MAIPYVKSGSTLTVMVGFRPVVITADHPNRAKIDALVIDPKATEEQINRLIDIPAAISEFTSGNVKVVDGRLYWKGFEVKSVLSKLILDMVKSGQPEAAKPFERFLDRAHSNPDPRAATDLYEWVAASGLPITEDGCVLAFKAVMDNYRSIHTPNDGRFDHHVGNIVEQPREQCDSNPDRTCSRGLHFCSASYLKSYAGGGRRVVVVKIDPADVVAFPKDYNNAKGRACKYQIVGEVPMDQVPSYYPQGQRVTSQFSAYNDTRFGDIAAAAKPQTPTKKSLGDFTVGDVWEDGDRRRHTITDIGCATSTYPIGAGDNEYTIRGRWVNKKLSPGKDLVRKVR